MAEPRVIIFDEDKMKLVVATRDVNTGEIQYQEFVAGDGGSIDDENYEKDNFDTESDDNNDMAETLIDFCELDKEYTFIYDAILERQK